MQDKTNESTSELKDKQYVPEGNEPKTDGTWRIFNNGRNDEGFQIGLTEKSFISFLKKCDTERVSSIMKKLEESGERKKNLVSFILEQLLKYNNGSCTESELFNSICSVRPLFTQIGGMSPSLAFTLRDCLPEELVQPACDIFDSSRTFAKSVESALSQIVSRHGNNKEAIDKLKESISDIRKTLDSVMNGIVIYEVQNAEKVPVSKKKMEPIFNTSIKAEYEYTEPLSEKQYDSVVTKLSEYLKDGYISDKVFKEITTTLDPNHGKEEV